MMRTILLKLLMVFLATTVLGLAGCGGGGSDSGATPTTVANIAPVANAGVIQSVVTGAVVTLDGSTSSDANGDLLTYSWAFTSKPAGSSATLSSATAAKPTFTADVAGAYVLNLVVDDGKISSPAVSVTISVTSIVVNAVPVANAGTAQNVVAGAVVTVNGTASTDSNGDLLTYNWSINSKPNGSSAVLSNATVAKPTFTADVVGAYILNLVVNDGKVNSSSASVTVTATGVNFSSLIGTYEGRSDITVGVTGTTLKITDADFLAGTCIYSATISAAGNALSAGTYQCSDFTTGNWTLSQMKVVDTNDIYISIFRNGTESKRLYGMSAKASSTTPPITIENIASFPGTYSGISNGGPFTEDTTTITVGVIGTALKITDAAFFGGTCIYSGTISATGNAISTGTYQCSDFSTGNWTLSQMKVVDSNDIYISIRKDGNVTSRMYGTK